MLNRKPLFAKTPDRLPQSKLPFDASDASYQTRLPKIEVRSLEIEQDNARDCDPYNRTGQFATIGATKKS